MPAVKERFGKFVLLEELGRTGLGTEYRAAKLGPAGLDRIVRLVRVAPVLSQNAEFARALMDQAKLASQLQSANVVKVLAIGRVDSAYYIGYEHVEGKSLGQLFERSRREGFPLAPDQALLVASRTCGALEYAHSKRTEGGHRFVHGLLTPDAVLVSYDGEVRVRGFGYWSARLREAGGVTPEEALYLAPEQVSGGNADVRSDVFSAGALLFEALTGQPLLTAERGDVAARLASARLVHPSGESEPLPGPIADILSRSLAAEPGRRYAEIQEMRKAIDTHLFSGEFTPTTFNLAFFLHSLFRDDIERDTRLLAEDRAASYSEYLSGEAFKTPPPIPVDAAAVPAPAPVAATPPSPAVAARPHPLPPPVREPQPSPAAARAEPGLPASPREEPVVASGDAPAVLREAASAAPPSDDQPRPRTPLLIGVAAVVLAAAGGGYLLLRPGPPPAAPTPPTTTLSAEAVAAMARVKELEEKLKAFEAEKAAAEQKAAEDAKKKLEVQAAARGQAVDPSALKKAQEEAARKAQAELDRRQQEERLRLEEEKRNEEARVVEERRRAEAAATAQAAPSTLPAAPSTLPAAPTTLPAAPTTLPAEPQPTAPGVAAAQPPAAGALRGAPPLQPGTLVDLGDVGVIPPVVVKEERLQYPPLALQQRSEGVVQLRVLVDEKGNVVDVKVLKGVLGLGLNQSAAENIRRRKYRPATKDGVPVKVWLDLSVRFTLPR